MLSLGAIVATFTAGLLSFFSPCTVPLLPAYLSVVSGVSAGQLATHEGRRSTRARLLLGSLLYVAGFATVLVALGFTFSGLTHTLLVNRRLIELVGGAVVIIFGLLILDFVHIPVLQRNWRLELPRAWSGSGVAIAYPLGVVFGIGWTPCAGPYLGVALGLAAASSTAVSGGALLAFYALGIGLPFIVVALAWASLPSLPQRLSALTRPLTLVGGALTVALGLALMTGLYQHVTSFFAQFAVPQ